MADDFPDYPAATADDLHEFAGRLAQGGGYDDDDIWPLFTLITSLQATNALLTESSRAAAVQLGETITERDASAAMLQAAGLVLDDFAFVGRGGSIVDRLRDLLQLYRHACLDRDRNAEVIRQIGDHRDRLAAQLAGGTV